MLCCESEERGALKRRRHASRRDYNTLETLYKAVP